MRVVAFASVLAVLSIAAPGERAAAGGPMPESFYSIQTTTLQGQGFCERNYGVTFPMFSKLVTKPGPEQSPVYAFLTKGGDVPKWNFSKYLVGKDGKVIAFFPSKVTSESKELREAIEAALR